MGCTFAQRLLRNSPGNSNLETPFDHNLLRSLEIVLKVYTVMEYVCNTAPICEDFEMSRQMKSMLWNISWDLGLKVL